VNEKYKWDIEYLMSNGEAFHYEVIAKTIRAAISVFNLDILSSVKIIKMERLNKVR
jgi:hypothetical protein